MPKNTSSDIKLIPLPTMSVHDHHKAGRIDADIVETYTIFREVKKDKNGNLMDDVDDSPPFNRDDFYNAFIRLPLLKGTENIKVISCRMKWDE